MYGMCRLRMGNEEGYQMDVQFWALIWVGVVVIVLGVLLYYVIKSYK